MRQSGVLILIVVFFLGVALGLVATATLPEMALVNLYEQWGLWGVIGRATIAILLVGLPITYLAWLVSSSIQAMRPQHPARSAPAPAVPLTPERILVPVGGGTNALLGLGLVNGMANGGPARVTLMRVVPPSMTDAGIAAQEEVLRQMAREHLGRDHEVEVRVVASPSVVEAIVQEARRGGYDLLVVGATQQRAFRTLLFGALPHTLAEQVPCPLVVVHPGGGPT
ncbi:MAG: universal stress protein [Anaerolineae bacterium]